MFWGCSTENVPCYVSQSVIPVELAGLNTLQPSVSILPFKDKLEIPNSSKCYKTDG